MPSLNIQPQVASLQDTCPILSEDLLTRLPFQIRTTKKQLKLPLDLHIKLPFLPAEASSHFLTEAFSEQLIFVILDPQ